LLFSGLDQLHFGSSGGKDGAIKHDKWWSIKSVYLMGGRSTIEEKLQQEEEHQKEGKEWARAALKMAKQNYQK
jgi:hypothetical protein